MESFARRDHPFEILVGDQASARGAAAYLLDARSSRVLSYAELFWELRASRRRLRAWHVGPGSRVGLAIEDPLSFATWFLAGLLADVWVAPLDPKRDGANLAQIDQRARTLALTTVLSDRAAPTGASARWIDVRADDHRSREVSEDVELASDQRGGVLLSSSGTTGAPKVMALSLEQLLAAATLIARHNELGESDRGFNALPLWHINAEVVGLLATLLAGGSLVLDDRFHRTGFWKIIEDFEVTWINAVPAILARLVTLQGDEVPSHRVRFVRSASAPLAPALFNAFEAATGIPIIESYGMTEAASQICANPLRGVRKAGSVGRAVGVDLRVVTGRGEARSAGPRVVGHVEIKGPTVITAYESPEYDGRFDREGWLRTGDLGYLDEDGYLFLVGRNDDVINRGGEKIYPLEIEHALATVEGVAAVAVIAQLDEVFGQVPVAFVQPVDVQVTASVVESARLVQRLRECVTDRFVRASRPTVFKIVREFSVHATGKIRKGPLREGDVVVAYEERI